MINRPPWPPSTPYHQNWAIQYRLRKSTVEPVIGIIKGVLGFRQFSLRGLFAAGGKWTLVCLAYNLKRLHTLYLN